MIISFQRGITNNKDLWTILWYMPKLEKLVIHAGHECDIDCQVEHVDEDEYTDDEYEFREQILKRKCHFVLDTRRYARLGYKATKRLFLHSSRTAPASAIGSAVNRQHTVEFVGNPFADYTSTMLLPGVEKVIFSSVSPFKSPASSVNDHGSYYAAIMSKCFPGNHHTLYPPISLSRIH